MVHCPVRDKTGHNARLNEVIRAGDKKCQRRTNWDNLGHNGTERDRTGQNGTQWDSLGQNGTNVLLVSLSCRTPVALLSHSYRTPPEFLCLTARLTSLSLSLKWFSGKKIP